MESMHSRLSEKHRTETRISFWTNGVLNRYKYFYTTHSELNAILNYRGGSLEGAKLYVTLFPCNECAKAIIQAGIKTIVYDEDKYDGTPAVMASKRMLDAAGVRYYRYQHTGREIQIKLWQKLFLLYEIYRKQKNNYSKPKENIG